MEIIIARYSGFCYGVDRAVNMVRKLVREGQGPIHVLGNLIHNPTVVQELAQAGVRKVNRVDEANDGFLVIRSHGVPKQAEAEAQQRGLKIIDTTCPNVKRAHEIAQKLTDSGYHVIVVGDPGHAEVEGILSYTDGRGIVVPGVNALREIADRLPGRNVGVLCQTTIHIENLKQVVEFLLGRTRELMVHNTICDVTGKRQAATLELAKEVDLMLIVGGKESANTARLVEISIQTGVPTHQIETGADLDPQWFRKSMKVGLAAGASTPSEIMQEARSILETWETEGTIG